MLHIFCKGACSRSACTYICSRRANMLYIWLCIIFPRRWLMPLLEGWAIRAANYSGGATLPISFLCCPAYNFDCGEHPWNSVCQSLPFFVDSGEWVEVGSGPMEHHESIVVNLLHLNAPKAWYICERSFPYYVSLYLFLNYEVVYCTFPWTWDSDWRRACSDLVYEHTTYPT